MNSNMIAQLLADTGICVCPDFLSPSSLNEIRTDLDTIHAQGDFQRASVGQNDARAVQELVRWDQTHWLDRQTSNPVQFSLWEKLDLLQQSLNRTLFLGLREFEGHYAIYPEGGFYKKHFDSFQQNNDRMVSVVIYLNHDWQEKDGGQLRMYSKDSHVDICPIGGTLVCFMSQESEHEVLLSHASRYSFTGWFKTGVARLNPLVQS
jgi:SM-20-related protein